MLFPFIVIMSVCTVVHRSASVVESPPHSNNSNIQCSQVMLPDVSSCDEEKTSNSGLYDPFDLSKIDTLAAEFDLNTIDRAEELTHMSAVTTRQPGNLRSHIFGNADCLAIFPGQDDLPREIESRKGMKDGIVRFREMADRLSTLLHDPDGKMGNIQNATMALWSTGVCKVVGN